MSRRLAALALPLLLATSVAHAAPAASARHAPVAHHAAVARPAAAPPSAAAPAGGARTLDDIHIEGEIPVPQVLFITARDQRRFLEFQHRRYLRTSRELGEATARPSWIVVTQRDPQQAKEAAR